MFEIICGIGNVYLTIFLCGIGKVCWDARPGDKIDFIILPFVVILALFVLPYAIGKKLTRIIEDEL